MNGTCYPNGPMLKRTTFNVAEDNMLQTEEENSLNVFSIVTFKEVIYAKRMFFLNDFVV